MNTQWNTQEFINTVQNRVNEFGVNNSFNAVDAKMKDLQTGTTTNSSVAFQQMLNISIVCSAGRRAKEEENQNQQQAQAYTAHF